MLAFIRGMRVEGRLQLGDRLTCEACFCLHSCQCLHSLTGCLSLACVDCVLQAEHDGGHMQVLVIVLLPLCTLWCVLQACLCPNIIDMFSWTMLGGCRHLTCRPCCQLDMDLNFEKLLKQQRMQNHLHRFRITSSAFSLSLCLALGSSEKPLDLCLCRLSSCCGQACGKVSCQRCSYRRMVHVSDMRPDDFHTLQASHAACRDLSSQQSKVMPSGSGSQCMRHIDPLGPNVHATAS